MNKHLQINRGYYIRETTKKWSMPIRIWGIILNQFLIIFENRLK